MAASPPGSWLGTRCAQCAHVASHKDTGSFWNVLGTALSVAFPCNFLVQLKVLRRVSLCSFRSHVHGCCALQLQPCGRPEALPGSEASMHTMVKGRPCRAFGLAASGNGLFIAIARETPYAKQLSFA